MKQTDGLFRKVFNEIATEYPEIASEHWIIDIGAAKLADTPETFDVIVTPNLYGDVVSDIAAQITGSVGLAGSANIGEECAMFEAIHGSAPDIAGKDLANPSGLLQAAVMMLNHLGETAVAEQIQNAWLRTLEEGIHTADIYREGVSTLKVGTRAFAEAVIHNLGKKPEQLKPAASAGSLMLNLPRYQRKQPAQKKLEGVDVFIHWAGYDANELAEKLHRMEAGKLRLTMITNRGIKVWPNGFKETFCTDHWRCRFQPTDGEQLSNKHILELLAHAVQDDIDTIKTENLYSFDGRPAYSLGQGQ